MDNKKMLSKYKFLCFASVSLLLIHMLLFIVFGKAWTDYITVGETIIGAVALIIVAIKKQYHYILLAFLPLCTGISATINLIYYLKSEYSFTFVTYAFLGLQLLFAILAFVGIIIGEVKKSQEVKYLAIISLSILAGIEIVNIISFLRAQVFNEVFLYFILNILKFAIYIISLIALFVSRIIDKNMGDAQNVSQIVTTTADSTPIPNISAPPAPESNISVADKLTEYKELLDMGAITQEEFDKKKNELLT